MADVRRHRHHGGGHREAAGRTPRRRRPSRPPVMSEPEDDQMVGAVQDMQYIAALLARRPRPTKRLSLPKRDHAIRRYEELLRADDGALSFETVLMEPLGYFFVRISWV